MLSKTLQNTSKHKVSSEHLRKTADMRSNGKTADMELLQCKPFAAGRSLKSHVHQFKELETILRYLSVTLSLRLRLCPICTRPHVWKGRRWSSLVFCSSDACTVETPQHFEPLRCGQKCVCVGRTQAGVNAACRW